MSTYQGASWMALDAHLTGGALRQDGPGWSGRKVAAAGGYDRRARGRRLAELRRSNAAGLHVRRTPRGQARRRAIGESRAG